MTRTPTPSLVAAQHWLLAVVTHPDSAAEGVLAQAAAIAQRDLEQVVTSNSIASALERLEVYQQGYFARLEECLADDYPAVKFAVGDSKFERICRAYTEVYPSRHPSLNGFGARFAAFIAASERDSGRFLAELSQLEWAIVEVLHARASKPLTASDLSSVAPQHLVDLRFEPNSALRLLSFEYPVNAYYQAFKDGEEPELPAPCTSAVAVVRSGYRIWRLGLNSTQSMLLRRLLSGASLSAALLEPTADADALRSWFRQWTECGVFARAYVEGVIDDEATDSTNHRGKQTEGR